MSWTSPIRHAARAIAIPFVDTRVTPNHMTTVRVGIGLGAIVAFALGGDLWSKVGGSLFLLALVLDKADGELARLSGKSSPGGRRYDMLSDAVTTVLTFAAIGIGLQNSMLGEWHLWTGFIAATGIAIVYWFMYLIDEMKYRPEQAADDISGFEPDDGLIGISIAAWLGWLAPMLLITAICGVVGSVIVIVLYQKMRRASPSR